MRAGWVRDMFGGYLWEKVLRTALLGLLLVVPLAACSTTTPAQRFAAMETSCQSYGFKKGSDAYGNCMMQQDMANARADAANEERFRNGLRAMGRAMTPPPTVTCNTFGSANRLGNSVYGNSTTTCQ